MSDKKRVGNNNGENESDGDLGIHVIVPWAEDPDHEEGSGGYKGNGKRKKKKMRNKFIALLVLAAIVAVVCFFFDDLKRLVFVENVADDPTLGIEMVYVEGGTFVMGDEDDDEAGSDKLPHRVSLGSYYIGKYEVTVGLWKAVMGYVPEACADIDREPVCGISWEEAQDFVNELNVMTGKNYRLPTEAEWEYAARGGNKSRGCKYAGSHSVTKVAWYGECSYRHKVGTKQPNELGIYDMSGNVEEWCYDWYDSDYYDRSPLHNPQGPSSGTNKVCRGGYYNGDVEKCEVSYREYCDPSSTKRFRGLRLALGSVSIKQPVEQPQPTRPKPQQPVQQQPEPEPMPATVQQPERPQHNLPDIAMVYVSGGTFTMGATSEQGSDAWYYEKPAHSVTLSGYYIGKYEVTQELWKAVMGSNPSKFKGDNLPVECVSWDDVQEFLRKLNAMTGKRYRLPTEAEWEFAARGGNSSRGYKYSGSNSLGSVAWYGDNSGDRTHSVGTKSPNELGIYDMSGNVWEWCHDWYGSYSSSPQRNPKGPNSGSKRVYRGGDWLNSARNCRVSERSYETPGLRISDFGFRLAL